MSIRWPVLCAVLACHGLRTWAAENPSTDPASIETRIDSLLAQMSMQEKLSLIAGNAMMSTPGLPRIGIPALYMSDGPVGAHVPNPSTAYAAGIALAASWDTELARQVGIQIGRDARSRGANFLLGPGVNIYRSPLNGRNFEYFGEDPWLDSRIAVGYIEGVQSERVSATVKHYVANDSEYDRHNSDSIIDERTLREIYLPVFEAAVGEAHVGAVMSAYNLVNGEHMSQNAYLDTEVLKRQWGFDGLLMSDWGSTYDGVAAANAGLDLEMPRGLYMTPTVLLPALNSGTVQAAIIDDKVRRLLRVAVRFGWLDQPQLDISVPRYNETGRAITLRAAEESMVLLKNSQHALPLDRRRIRTIALIGPDAYPGIPTGGGSGQVQTFSAVSLLTALSDYLGPNVQVLYQRGVRTLAQMTRATVLTINRTGGTRGVTLETYANDTLAGSPIATTVEPIATMGQLRPILTGGDEVGSDVNGVTGTSTAGGGVATNPNPDFLATGTVASSVRLTGYFTPARPGNYIVAIQESNRFRLLVDGQVVLDDSLALKATMRHATVQLSAEPHKIVIEHFHSATRTTASDFIQCAIVDEDDFVNPTVKAMAAKADVAIVAVGFDAVSEGEGQDREFQLPPGQDELIRDVAATNKHTIVIVTSGGSVALGGFLDNVSAIIEGWYSGEEGGTALAHLLFGAANFSGRLPISWEREVSDGPSAANYYFEDPVTQKINYAEGIFTGYRGYEHSGVAPLFPFGYGLSYSTFSFDHLQIRPHAPAKHRDRDPLYDVAFDITNTGKIAGAEIGEVYVGDDTPAPVERPAKELKGFARVFLKPGEKRRVHVSLNARSFAYYDVDAKAWQAGAGRYRITVGRSVADIALSQDLQLPSAITIPLSP
ncbi:MAG: glycoside hydrolase family 3 C-terminal domain-containing protein [Steroidobacteraceae bacterium]|jgi:beta-glucosidase